MTTEHIDTVAKAGFASYFATRRGYTWDAAPFPIRCRWTIVAAAFCNGTLGEGSDLRTARQLRDRYIGEPNDDRTGSTPHSIRTDLAWQRVFRAMATARDAAFAGEVAAA
ncbi:MAG: hypothetical protein M3457_22575 [Chloroflexota bacterium]|nr:hypothetical protein [Chloroflexota bacterium]